MCLSIYTCSQSPEIHGKSEPCICSNARNDWVGSCPQTSDGPSGWDTSGDIGRSARGYTAVALVDCKASGRCSRKMLMIFERTKSFRRKSVASKNQRGRRKTRGVEQLRKERDRGHGLLAIVPARLPTLPDSTSNPLPHQPFYASVWLALNRRVDLLSYLKRSHDPLPAQLRCLCQDCR